MTLTDWIGFTGVSFLLIAFLRNLLKKLLGKAMISRLLKMIKIL